MVLSSVWYRFLGFLSALLMVFSVNAWADDDLPSRDDAGDYALEVMESLYVDGDIGPYLTSLTLGAVSPDVDEEAYEAAKKQSEPFVQSLLDLVENHDGIDDINVVKVDKMGTAYFASLEIEYEDGVVEPVLVKMAWLKDKKLFVIFE